MDAKFVLELLDKSGVTALAVIILWRVDQSLRELTRCVSEMLLELRTPRHDT